MNKGKIVIFTLFLFGLFLLTDKEALASNKGFENYGSVYFDKNGDVYFSIQFDGLRMGIEKYDKKTGKVGMYYDDNKKVYHTNGFSNLKIHKNYIYFVYNKLIGSATPGDFGLYRLKKNGKKAELVKKNAIDYVIKGDKIYFVKRTKSGEGEFDFSYGLSHCDLNGSKEKQISKNKEYMNILLYRGEPVYTFYEEYGKMSPKNTYYTLKGKKVTITTKKIDGFRNARVVRDNEDNAFYFKVLKNVDGYDYYLKKNSEKNLYRKSVKTGKESFVTTFKKNVFMCDVFVKGQTLVVKGYGEYDGNYSSTGYIKVVDLKKKKDILVKEWSLAE